ncbi:MAG: hypothetical protein GY716_22830 [bacterium]|nr:hypothetical protein [bacterium]
MRVRRVRPRFRTAHSDAPEALLARIVDHVKQPACPCEYMASNPHRLVELRVPEAERHLWSPVLAVTISDGTEGESVVDGLLGPSPSVWTFFAMLYTGLSTFILFALIFGTVQWSLNSRPWGLWVAVGLCVSLAAAYGSSLFGQRLAAPQTATLRRILDDALDRL